MPEEPNRHLEAAFEQLIDRYVNGLDRSAASELARAVTMIMPGEEAEDWAGALDDAIHRYEREQSGEADRLAEGPGRSGGAI